MRLGTIFDRAEQESSLFRNGGSKIKNIKKSFKVPKRLHKIKFREAFYLLLHYKAPS